MICVIDTGVDYTHPDLAANIWRNTREVPDNGVDDDIDGIVDNTRGASFINGVASNDVMDENSHGTLCSGEIAAVQNNNIGISGVAPQATILPCKYMDATGSGQIFDAISCINFCVDKKAVVISASWGYTNYVSLMDDVMRTLSDKNIIFVASAGNSGSNTDFTIHYPSWYSSNFTNVISVGAVNQEGKLSAISNYGNTSIDILAPGQAILSTLPGVGYGIFSGTSSAVPLVSGTIALIKSLYQTPKINIKQLLTNYSSQMTKKQPHWITSGILNAELSVSKAGISAAESIAQPENIVSSFANMNRIYIILIVVGLLVTIVLCTISFVFIFRKIYKSTPVNPT